MTSDSVQGMTVIVKSSLMVRQTRFLIGSRRKMKSSGGPAIESVSLTGLRVMGRFDTVVMPVSAAITAIQLSKAGVASLESCMGCIGGARGRGIESARVAMRWTDSIGI